MCSKGNNIGNNRIISFGKKFKLLPCLPPQCRFQAFPQRCDPLALGRLDSAVNEIFVDFRVPLELHSCLGHVHWHRHKISEHGSKGSVAKSLQQAVGLHQSSLSITEIDLSIALCGNITRHFSSTVLEQVVQGMSVFLLTTNMRLFLNPIINHIFSPTSIYYSNM